MGKHTNCVKTQDVEEGEISDTPSVEEITEEDFNKLETAPKLLPSKHSNRETTVWTMSDLYNNYPTMCRGYASGLYNLAWAKAVQNKPLNEIFLMDADPDDKSNRSSSSPFRNAKEHGNGTKQEAKLIIDITGDDMNSDNADVEKEEGELEEGEIDMDTEFVEEVVDSKPMLSDSLDTDYQEIDLKNKELDDQLKLIHKTLDAVTIDAAQK